MHETIKNFNKQFEYEPIIENEAFWKKYKKFIITGMGGSALAGDILKTYDPDFDIVTHTDYGLPQAGLKNLKKSLVIASSYSGNTEEAVDAFQKSLVNEINVSAITTDGKLIELAKRNGVPYIKMPVTGIQPRMALGYSLVALLKMMGKEKTIKEIKKSAASLNPEAFENQGKELAGWLKDTALLVYSSFPNKAIAYNWKIKMNETGKIPAFYNCFPELNHNEMAGFDNKPFSKHINEQFSCIILKDPDDHPRIQKRMDVLEKIYGERGVRAMVINMPDSRRFDKIFSSLILADWTSYYAAKQREAEPERVQTVEEFKKMLE